jgi:hypothetical protein
MLVPWLAPGEIGSEEIIVLQHLRTLRNNGLEGENSGA